MPTISQKIESGLYQLMDSRLQALGCGRYAIGGTMDHVHILHGLPRDKTIADILCDVKSISSKWMSKQGYDSFAWQVGYACHSVDYRTSERIIHYVNNQKKHHYGSQENYTQQASLTFKEEFETLLTEFDIDYQIRWLFPDCPTLPPHAAPHPKTDHQYRRRSTDLRSGHLQ